MSIPNALKKRIVKEARKIRGTYGVSTTNTACCLFDACAVIEAAKKHGIRLVMQAGSAYWTIEDKPPPGEVYPMRFGYEWEGLTPYAIQLLQTGRLPEMHVWAGDPERNELVDTTTKYWPEQCLGILGQKWTAKKPPDFLWSAEMVPGTEYRPDGQATSVAHILAERLCRKGAVEGMGY